MCLEILGCKLLKTICIWSLSDGLSIISMIFTRQREMNNEIDSFVLCLRASSSFLDISTTVLNETIVKTPEPSHPMSGAVRTPKMQTIAGLPHSEIVGIKWSSETHLIHRLSSLCYKVGGGCEDNQCQCTSQCQASWTWLENWPLTYPRDHPKQRSHQIPLTVSCATL